jgi:hypothetical protein
MTILIVTLTKPPFLLFQPVAKTHFLVFVMARMQGAAENPYSPSGPLILIRISHSLCQTGLGRSVAMACCLQWAVRPSNHISRPTSPPPPPPQIAAGQGGHKCVTCKVPLRRMLLRPQARTSTCKNDARFVPLASLASSAGAAQSSRSHERGEFVAPLRGGGQERDCRDDFFGRKCFYAGKKPTLLTIKYCARLWRISCSLEQFTVCSLL